MTNFFKHCITKLLTKEKLSLLINISALIGTWIAVIIALRALDHQQEITRPSIGMLNVSPSYQIDRECTKIDLSLYNTGHNSISEFYGTMYFIDRKLPHSYQEISFNPESGLKGYFSTGSIPLYSTLNVSQKLYGLAKLRYRDSVTNKEYHQCIWLKLSGCDGSDESFTKEEISETKELLKKLPKISIKDCDNNISYRS